MPQACEREDTGLYKLGSSRFPAYGGRNSRTGPSHDVNLLTRPYLAPHGGALRERLMLTRVPPCYLAAVVFLRRR